MKIVKNKRNIVNGFKDPMPFLNLLEIFNRFENIELVRDLGSCKCALRFNERALKNVKAYKDCNAIGSCPNCFWGSNNPLTKEKQKEVFNLLKMGIDVEYIE